MYSYCQVAKMPLNDFNLGWDCLYSPANFCTFGKTYFSL